jgi:hypothetical protein
MFPVGVRVSGWLVGMSATALHPDQFSNEEYSEPATAHIASVVRFASLPDQPVALFNPRDPGRGQMQAIATMADPVWGRGEHRLVADVPQAEPYTGRPLSERPGQVDVRGSQLDDGRQM